MPSEPLALRRTRPGPVCGPALLVLVGLLAAAPRAQAGTVRHVPGDHATVQAAVTAAGDGDVILIAAGVHGGNVDVDGKSLSLVGDSIGLPPRLTGSVSIRRTTSGQPVLVQGLRLWSEQRRPAVTVKDCDGVVRLEACDVRGLTGFNQPNDPVHTGYPGVRVERSRAVTIAGCEVSGGSGSELSDDQPEYGAGPGATALDLIDAGMLVTGSLVRGGSGGSVSVAEPDSGGTGGPGIRSHSSTLWLVDCEVFGGQGGFGDCDFFGCGSGGSGGFGLWQTGAVTAATRLRGTSIEGGSGGTSGDGVPTEPASDTLVQAGTLGTWHAPPGRLSVTSPVRAGGSGLVEAAGGGALVGLLVSPDVAHVLAAQNLGVLQVGEFVSFLLGTATPPGATLELPFDVPLDALAGAEALLLRIQAASLNDQGVVLLEPAATLVLLDDGV